MRSFAATCAVVALATGCADRWLVRDDDMSARQHRAEARREQAAAARAEQLAGSVGGGAPSSADPQAYDGRADRAREPELRREHARRHEASAGFLERFEDRACADVPPGERAACPLLGPLVRLDDIPGGVRATFAHPARARKAITEMNCQYAYARARHFEENAGCPLYVLGIDIRPGLDPRWVEIVSSDRAAESAIRARAREQAIYSRAAP
jgi:hypothetical protein